MNTLNVSMLSILLLTASYLFMEGTLGHEEGSFSCILKYIGIALLCILLAIPLPLLYAVFLSHLLIFSFLGSLYHKESKGIQFLLYFLLLYGSILLFHSTLLHITTELLSIHISITSIASTLFLFSELYVILPLLIKRLRVQYELPSFPVFSLLFFILWLLLCHQLTASTGFLFLYFCTILLLSILMKQCMRLELQSKRVLLEHVTQLQAKENEERYAWLLQENQYMARTIHDMKKHLGFLDTYMKEHEDETIASYRKEAARQADELLDGLRYGNPMVDRILRIYTIRLKEANISLNIEMDDVDISFIEPVDFSAVLMNMLDNALTSCMQAKEKFILLKIKEISPEVLVLKMKNSCDFIKIQNGSLVTSKKNTLYHGFGLKNMEQIAHKYHGAVHTLYDEEHHIFTTTVRLKRND